MKLLRNPIVAGAAVMAAIGVFAWTLLSPGHAANSNPPNAAFAADPPAIGPFSESQPGETTPADESSGLMDLDLVRERFPKWIEAPERDPFEAAPPQGPVGPPASELLRLAAIWRQTGGQFAIINGQVLGEGDSIAGFKLERIEGDVIWVSGTNGMERIEFSHRTGREVPRSPEGADASAVTVATAAPPTG
jgi:hypothetical protein